MFALCLPLVTLLLIQTPTTPVDSAAGQPVPARTGQANWPQWRGDALTGVSGATRVPLEWSETKNIRWKTPLPSWSGATPIVWGDRVFVTSPSASSDEPASIGRTFGRGGRSDPGGKDVLLMCFSASDGKPLWQRVVGTGNALWGKQNSASPSPVTDGKMVWCLTGTGAIGAFDMSGEPKWSVNLQDEYGPFGLYWGYGSSPLLLDDVLVAQVIHGCTTDDPSYVVALDKMTGKVRWKVERPTDAVAESPDAYTTPTVLDHQGKRRIIISGADYVTAHDAKTGAEVWRCGGLNPGKERDYRICGSPIALDGVIYATSRRDPMIAIRAGGEGDVTSSHTMWKFDKGPDVPSAACDGRLIYLADDRGVATCLNAKTGKVVWGPERTEAGTVSASPIVADGRVYITNESAVTTVLAAGPEFKVLATNRLDDGYTISSPAIVDGRVYIRTSTHLVCIGD